MEDRKISIIALVASIVAVVISIVILIVVLSDEKKENLVVGCGSVAPKDPLSQQRQPNQSEYLAWNTVDRDASGNVGVLASVLDSNRDMVRE